MNIVWWLWRAIYRREIMGSNQSKTASVKDCHDTWLWCSCMSQIVSLCFSWTPGARSIMYIVLKPGLHCPDCGARWSPMAKSAGFVSASANSEGTSVNNVTLPGNILRHRQWRPNVRPTSANCPERTNMFVNFGYVGGESVYRGLSGNIGKRTQENASPSGFFPGYICNGYRGWDYNNTSGTVNIIYSICVLGSIPWERHLSLSTSITTTQSTKHRMRLSPRE